MRGWKRPRAALLVYPLLALVAYPVSEYVVAGTRASVYGLDVFDDGSVARLGALAPTWAEHGLSLWDPFLTAGNAWFSQFALPPIAPDSLLTLLLTPFQAFFAIQLALPLVAGLAMHLFVRRSLRLPVAASVVGAIVYALSLWHYPIGLAGPAIPLLLTMVDRPPRSHALAVAALGAVVAVVLHQGLLQVALLAGAAQLAWIGLAMPRARRPRALGTWLGGWILAALVAAPMILSLAVALPDSHRTVWDLAPELSLDDALAQLARLYGSVVLAVPLPGGWGLHPPYLGTWFAGAVALPLVGLGLCLAAMARRPFRFIAVLAVAVPLVDLVSLLIGPWLEEAGSFGSFQFDRVRHFVPFVLACAAAIGLAGIGAVRGRHPRRWVARLALGVPIAILALQAPTVLERLGDLRSLGRQLAPDWLRVTWLAASIAGAALVLVGTARRPRGRTLAAAALLGLLVVTGVERATYLRIERGAVPNATTSWHERLGGSAIVDRLRAETEADHSRVLVTGLHPNEMLFHRVPSVTGYENAYPLRMHRLLDVLFAPFLDGRPELAEYYRAWGNRAVAFEPIWARQIVDLLAARWVVTDEPIEEPGMTAVLRDGGRTLYRNESALPRAFVVTASRVFEERAALLDALAAADTAELAATAYLESDALTGGPRADGGAEFVTDAPDRVELRVTSPVDGLLVLSDAFMPGWWATVDGEPAEILPAYVALRAVAVPAGESTVVFTYEPIHTIVGLGLSVVGLGALLLLVVVGVRRR